jgi:methionine-rich copper-binding protein CopC
VLADIVHGQVRAIGLAANDPGDWAFQQEYFMITKNLLAAFVLCGAAASAAQAHAKLEASQPRAGSELASPPKEVRLHFNEQLEPAFSKIQLVDAKDAELPLPKAELDKADPKVMFTTLPLLQSGQYRVRWTTMTHDGHKTKGEIAFRVK